MAGARIGALLARLMGWAGAHPLRRAALTLALGLAVLLPGLAFLPVTDRDEARFAQSSRQMLETGDLIDIRLQDEPRWKKPAGIYWLQAASAWLAGGPEAGIWAYRLPSLLGALAAALILGWAARPLAGDAAAALAALMLATTLIVAAEASLAKTDAALLAAATAVMGALARLMLWTDRPPRLADVLMFWGALGASVLLKGPIVPAVAALALVWLGFARREMPRLGRLRPAIGLPLLGVIVLPWLVAIAIVSRGEFFSASVGEDLLGKVGAAQEAHGAPPGTFLLAAFGTLWPWAALLPLALPWAWRNRQTTALRFLAAWVIPFWLVLEIVPTKLPHYTLPLYPALLVLIAAWATGPARTAHWAPWQRQVAAALLVLPGAVGIGAALGLPLWVEGRLVPGAALLAALAVPCLVLGVRAALAGNPMAQIAGSLGAAACLFPALLAFALPALQTVFLSPRLAAAQAPWQACASGPALSVGYREPSLVFLTGTGTGLPTAPEAAARLAADAGALVWVEERFRADLDAALPAGTALVERAAVEGFNYNRGKATRIVLLTRADPRWAPCGG